MAEPDVAALVDTLRHAPQGAGELAALLPENLPIYAGRSAGDMSHLRGYLLAAFADTGLPDAALPYVVESLETGHVAYEVAGAAVGLRGLATPTADVIAPLLCAIDNLAGADATITFEAYTPAWPYRQPTTALTEVVRTIGHFGAVAGAVLPELEILAQQGERFSSVVRDEMQHVLESVGAGPSTVHRHAGCPSESRPPVPALETGPSHSCCAEMNLHEQAPDESAMRAVLEDQDGRPEIFAEFFTGRPSIVAFFYTRCDNPYKCSLTITKLAALQGYFGRRGLADAVNVTAITYDPEFDVPSRLTLYGKDRGLQFGEQARFFRVTSGFQELRQRFNLGVNYGPAAVNRHQSEIYLLNDQGDISAAFTRQQWDVEAVAQAVENLFPKPNQVRNQQNPTSEKYQ
jgi:protein SCO1/2